MTNINPITQKQPELARNAHIRALYATGKLAMQDIADMYEITRQRVHQIIRKQERLHAKGEK